MGQLIVRNLDEALRRRLFERAVKHGRSVEEEVRDILRDAVATGDAPSLDAGREGGQGFGTQLHRLFMESGLEEGFEIPEERWGPPTFVDFEE